MEMSYPLNIDEYIYAEVVQLWHYGRTTGVFSADDNLAVTTAGAMTINVSPGVAWLHFSQFGGIVYGNTEDLTFDLDIGEPVLHRIDRVVIRYDIVRNKVNISTKRGIPASNPVPPPLQRDTEAYELCIFDIRINAGTSAITQGMITDQRLNDEVCGIVRDGVQRIPTQMLYDQWNTWFSNLSQGSEATTQEWMDRFRETIDQLLSELVIDAEQRSSDYVEHIATLKSLASSRNQAFIFDQDALQQASYQQVAQWFNRLQAESEADVADLVSALQGMLTGDAAVELLARIIAHEQKQVASEEGAHGNRYWNKAFQVRTAEGWITVVGAVVEGIRAVYFNQMGWTAAEFNALFMTGEDFNSLREVS